MLLCSYSYADCFGPEDKTIKTNVLSCRNVNPVKEIKNLSSLNNSERIIKEYNGHELNTSFGKIFVHSYFNLTCSDFNKEKESKITIRYACCDGDPNVPCLLGYSELLIKYEK